MKAQDMVVYRLGMSCLNITMNIDILIGLASEIIASAIKHV
jgi:hypothetical protein